MEPESSLKSRDVCQIKGFLAVNTDPNHLSDPSARSRGGSRDRMSQAPGILPCEKSSPLVFGGFLFG
jgi:hypothetical protein